MYLDNMLLWKADGSVDTLASFNKKLPDEFDGIASGKLIPANSTGDVKSSINPVRTVATSKMHVSVQPGLVSAIIPTTSAPAKATLLNSMGQVIAQQNIAAGTSSVELRSNFRGPAVLMVKQGSQRYMQKVILK